MTSDTSPHTIEAGAFNVGYIDEGSGEPLILVHGGESNRTQFTALRPHLGDQLRVISYDQRDSGVTTGPKDPYDVATLADDLSELVEALGLHQVHILGTSFGGAVAQQFALRHPEKLRSLILVCTTPSINLPSPALERILNMGPDERREAAVDFLFSVEGRKKDPELVSRNWTSLVSRPKDADARRHAAAVSHDVLDQLDAIQAPTLVIHGDEDQMATVDGAQILAQRIPGARLELIEGARHGIATEFADVVAGLSREFIAEHSIDAAVRG